MNWNLCEKQYWNYYDNSKQKTHAYFQEPLRTHFLSLGAKKIQSKGKGEKHSHVKCTQEDGVKVVGVSIKEGFHRGPWGSYRMYDGVGEESDDKHLPFDFHNLC